MIPQGSLDLQRFAKEVRPGRVNSNRGDTEDSLQRYRAEGTDHEQRTMGKIDNP